MTSSPNENSNFTPLCLGLRLRRFFKLLFFVAGLSGGSFLTVNLVGCGSTDGGISDWQKTVVVQGVADISGMVVKPSSTGGSLASDTRAATDTALPGGIFVYVEERPEFSATADGEGQFLIRQVPLGKYHLVADTLQGASIWKGRSDLVSLTEADKTFQMPTLLDLVRASYYNRLILSDGVTTQPVPTGVWTIWGRSLTTTGSGSATLGPMPAGVWPVRIQSAGYHDANLLVTFGENIQDTLEFALNPLTAADSNGAPLVELRRDFTTLKTLEMGGLSVSAIDPEGDPITFEWRTSGGSLSTTKGPSVVFTAPSTPGTAVIQAFARDTRGGWGRATMMCSIASGGKVVPPAQNRAPDAASSPFPLDQSTGLAVSFDLRWTASDPDGDVLRYDVLLGKSGSPLALYASGLTNPTCRVSDLDPFSRYFWQVICRDPYDALSTGNPTWQFDTYASTSSTNLPPGDPEVIDPTSGSGSVSRTPTLRWRAADPDGDTLGFDVFLGTTVPLAKAAENLSGSTHPISTPLKAATTYFWQVVVKDARGGVNPNSPTWSFTTVAADNHAPDAPVAVSPVNNAIEVATMTVLAWGCSDPDGDLLKYSVYLDAVSPPQKQVATGLTTTDWSVPSGLGQGQVYWWRVEAVDPAGLVTSSQEYRFTTRTTVDNQPPMLISVSPTAGSTGTSRSAVISLTFSEPMDKISVQNGLSLSPSANGTWNWDTPSKIVFAPSQSWASGSYQTFTLATQTARDLSGNLMAGGFGSGFTIVADAVIPSGYRSSGFALSGDVGDTLRALAAGLPAGRFQFAAAVSENATVTSSVRGNRVRDDKTPDLEGFKNTPEAAMRRLEAYWASTAEGKKPPANVLFPTAVRMAVSVGSERTFFVPAFGSVATSTAYPGNTINARCLGITANSLLWVDSAISAPDSALLSDIGTRFENEIRPKVRDAFGNEPDMGPDGETRVSIVITDAMTSGIIGLFNGVDLSARASASEQLRESNETKLIFLRYTLSSLITRYGTVAHEFEHMAGFWQKRSQTSSVVEEAWLSEGLAKYAEEVCGYGILDGDANIAQILRLTENNFRTLSLTQWNGIENYGLSYLFVRFLTEENRYSTTSRDAGRLLTGGSSAIGVANVEHLTGEAFPTTLGKFAISLLLNRSASAAATDYGFKGLDLKGTYSGVSLSGVPVDTVLAGGNQPLALPPHGIGLFKRVGDGGADTNLTFGPLDAKTKVWAIDERP
ncbi:MAG: Ig-like domain-containing protein [Candidatus Ozemobacteraceae bacterium]